MTRLVLALVLVGVAPGCFQAVQECSGSCVALADYCAKVPEVLACGYLKACGWTPSDLPCDEVAWRDRALPVEFPCSPALLQALDAGRVTYDSASAARCLASAVNSCRQVPAGCDSVFAGTLAGGAACRTLHECRPGLWCDWGGTCPGTCRPQHAFGSDVTMPELSCTEPYWSTAAQGGSFRCEKPRPLGAACEPGTVECLDGLWCAPTAGGGACSENQSGAACDLTGAFCNWAFACTQQGDGGRCTPWGGSGDRCSGPNDARPPVLPEAPPCMLGLACRTDGGLNGVCGLALHATEACRPSPATDLCAASARCDLDAGQCRPRGVQGQPCVPTAALLAHSPGFNIRSDCVGDLVCVAGTCRPPGAAGEHCNPGDGERNDGCSDGLVCSQETCVAPSCDL